MSQYSHISFKKSWRITEKTLFWLGQCEATIKAISNTPIQPKIYDKLVTLSLIKGAQATTAIEGNTLTTNEIEDIQKGENLPPSKEYQQKEVENILIAFNSILEEVVGNSKTELINPHLIMKFHKMVGNELGEHFDAIPGRFRSDNRRVGRYRAPNHEEVEKMITQLCDWLKKEFHYIEGQSFIDSVIQAIITHVYIEWIHPFGDGNGRTGRLLEFYLLLRAGNPNIASHILSNHYNMTRSEYYRHLDDSTNTGELTEFIEYAVLGFRDGLFETLKSVQNSQLEIAWKNYIYDKFADTSYKKIIPFKRKRRLALDFPLYTSLSLDEVLIINTTIARNYKDLGSRTLLRDLDELIEMNILRKNEDKYFANSAILRSQLAIHLNK